MLVWLGGKTGSESGPGPGSNALLGQDAHAFHWSPRHDWICDGQLRLSERYWGLQIALVFAAFDQEMRRVGTRHGRYKTFGAISLGWNHGTFADQMP